MIFIVMLALVIRRATSVPSSSERLWSTCKDAANSSALTFFIIGDWGRGNLNQAAVSKLMGDIAGRCLRPAFVISTGDNFYPSGVHARDDPQV